jgi:hypothetical protein
MPRLSSLTSLNSSTISSRIPTEPGSVVYLGGINSTTTAATQTSYTWTVPAGVTSISFVVTGAGAGGGLSNFIGSSYSGGGGGGGTAYRNNVTVTPGQTITFLVGNGGFAKSIIPYNSTVTSGYIGGAGGNSTVVVSGITCTATGGTAATLGNPGVAGVGGYPAGVYTGGGNGGNGGNQYGGGGGGAGGMSTAPSTTGRGGQGGRNPAGGAGFSGVTNGSGGGGGGGGFGVYKRGVSNYIRTGGYGGGGAAQTNGVNLEYFDSNVGWITSDGTTGTLAYRHDSIGTSLRIGAGGGSTYTVSSTSQPSGAYANTGTTGAVRIIWPGNTRQFPSTNVWVQNNSGTWV